MNCALQVGSASGQFSTALNQKALLTQLAELANMQAPHIFMDRTAFEQRR